MRGILRPADAPARDPEGLHQVNRAGPLMPLPDPSGPGVPPGAGEGVEFTPDELLPDVPEAPHAVPVVVEGIVQTHDVADPRWVGQTFNPLTGGSPVRIVNAYPGRSSVTLVNIGTVTIFLSNTEAVSLTSSFSLLPGATITIPTRADVWCDATSGASYAIAIVQTFRDG